VGEPRRLLQPGDDRVAQPTFTPDGRRITFTYQDVSGRRAAFIAVRGGPIRIVPDVFATHPRLSPALEDAQFTG
jgi:hypothetical protein